MRVYRRGEEFVAYMKEGDMICDFLGMVGADAAVERFEVARNIKEIRIQVNRLVNTETANLNSAIEAAQRQLADIRFLKSRNVKVNEIMEETMELRLKFPDCAVSELAKKFYITAAALHIRFKKIHELAEEIRKSEESLQNEKR